MQVGYCKRCHDKKRIKSIEKVNEDLQAILKTDEISNQCLSYCGPGANDHFVLVDDMIISAKKYDDLLEKLKDGE
ncbi:MAG: DUF1450 domain-containing protein [Mycoplasmatales bacterium]